jgi:Na+-translocating ferredoxin:NAD+ oxidoreductase RnfD subunit
MSAENVVVTQTAPVATSPKPLWARVLDSRYTPPAFITLILLVAQISYGILESFERTALAIGTAIVIEMVLGKVLVGKIPNLASAYITGISVGILVRSPAFWPYVVCSAIAITSKYVLRVKGRHIWNPSNFGICAMLFLAPYTVASLSVQWGNNIYPMIVIWALGALIIARLRRFHICATYVISFFVLAGVRSLYTGDPYSSEVAPITGPMYQLFTFFMITDPKTTLRSKQGQILVAFLVAFAEMCFRLAQDVHAPYYALFVVGPPALLIEMWLSSRRAAQAPK